MTVIKEHDICVAVQLNSFEAALEQESVYPFIIFRANRTPELKGEVFGEKVEVSGS